jgi:hypothetical protein
MSPTKASPKKMQSGVRKKTAGPKSMKMTKTATKKTSSAEAVIGTAIIDGVKVKILRPARKKGAIPAAKIRKAIAAVQKAKM